MPVDNKQTNNSPLWVSVGIDPLFTGVNLSYGQKTVLLKSGSLQNDITTAVLCGLERAGRVLGLKDLHELLVSVPIIRLCTSIAQTGLQLHLGQPIGLLVSDDLVSIGRRILSALGLPYDMVSEISAPKDPQLADRHRFAFNRLLNLGARCIGVCLAGSRRYSMDEQRIRKQIDRQYPPHYLGSVPILLSSDYETGLTDEERIVALAIDCYMRRTLQNHLNTLKSALSREGFTGVLLIAEGNGGLSPVPRVRPSTVAMAAQAALFKVTKYWFGQVGTLKGIALKIGSLNSEVTIIDGRENADIPYSSVLPGKTMGGVASMLLQRGGRFVLTASDSITGYGANCQNYKERSPTLLDAMLTLGYLSPYSLGRTGPLLDQAEAAAAMARLTGQGSAEVETVALRACNDIADEIAYIIRRHSKQRGIDPSKTAFLVCGEAGGVFACAIAERVGWNVIYTIPGSSMTLTTGTMMMELRQQFSYRLRDGINMQDPSVLQSIFNRLKRQSERMLHATRLSSLPVIHRYGIEYKAKDSDVVQHLYREIKDLQSVATDESIGGLLEINGYEPEALTLQLTGTLPKTSEVFGDIIFEMIPGSERKRKVYLGPALGWRDCLVYWLPDLGEGEVLSGPVLIEAGDTVYWVASGWHYIVGTEGMDRIEKR